MSSLNSEAGFECEAIWVRRAGRFVEASLFGPATDGHCLVRYHEDGSMELVPPDAVTRDREQDEVWVYSDEEWYPATLVSVAHAGQVLVLYDSDQVQELVCQSDVRRELDGAKAVRKTRPLMTVLIGSARMTRHSAGTGSQTCCSSGSDSSRLFGPRRTKVLMPFVAQLDPRERERWLQRAKAGVTRKMWEGADPAVRADKDILLTALRSAGSGFDAAVIYKCAPEKRRGDKDVYLAALAACGTEAAHGVFAAAPTTVRENRDRVVAALQAVKESHVATVLKAVPEKQLADIHVALAAVTKDGDAIKHLPEDLRKNREVIIRAVSANPGALQHVCAELREDPDVLKSIRERSGTG